MRKVSLEPTEFISEIDIHFADLMQRLSPNTGPELYLCAALASSQTQAGHVCLSLQDLFDPTFMTEMLGKNPDFLPKSIASEADVAEKLSQAGTVVGQPGQFKPLILDSQNRLYLNRYWQYQNRLADFLATAARTESAAFGAKALQQQISELFPTSDRDETDWQLVAALTALMRKLCVITGGPGTGKTFTVAKILALLITFLNRDLKIILAAPTGKAAVRLQDALKNARASLPISDEIKNTIPETASTIHRVLGYRPFSPYFRHDADNPLEVDVMVVDEVSMVDLALMAKLVDALPSYARLIMLGDNNQLASVEAGAILADICHESHLLDFSREFAEKVTAICGYKLPVISGAPSGLQDSVVLLQRSYRFGARLGIGEVSAAINSGQADQAFKILKSASYPDVQWRELGEKGLMDRLQKAALFYEPDVTPEDVFEHFERFRVLCSVRKGPFGVLAINTKLAQFARHLVNAVGDEWYPGQPIMITRNDYQLSLFNGDFGVILPDKERDGELMAFLQKPDGSVFRIRPFRLPEHETAYAMTVHKSQGSEFEQVVLLLPDRDTPVLTRELLYTGVTRAIKKAEIWGVESIFKLGVARQIRRASGLREALWGNT